MTEIYEISSLLIAIFIVLFSLASVYHSVRYLMITKFKKKHDWIVIMQTGVALSWVIVFSYIVEESIRTSPPTVIGSFGNIFIRPLILLSSVSVSIWARIRYKLEKNGGDNRWNSLKN